MQIKEIGYAARINLEQASPVCASRAATAILEQLFNASDLAVVGNFSSTDRTVAVAAVGANSSIISLILNLFIGIALGANVVIATAIGRKNQEEVQRAVHTSIIMSILGGVLIAILGNWSPVICWECSTYQTTYFLRL